MLSYKGSLKKVIVLGIVLIFALYLPQWHIKGSEFNRIPNSSYTGDSKIEMVDWESQELTVDQAIVGDYSTVDIDLNVGGTYNFNFRLSDALDVPINNSIVWLHIQFLPGGVSSWYSKPGVYPVAYGPEYYGPYFWLYALTNESGIASFQITFDHDYLADFFDAFGTIEGISSVEDIDLYIRVFSSIFTWGDMAISNPSQYICSTDEDVFNGTEIIPDYDFTNLSVQDPTYMTGRIHFHKSGLKIVTKEYYILEYQSSPSLYEDLIINFDVVTGGAVPRSVLGEGDWTYHVLVKFYDPSGVIKASYYKQIFLYPGDNGGYIEFDHTTIAIVCEDLGPGVSTIAMQVEESEKYEASPYYRIPLEARPPNWMKFDKDSKFSIDLVNPFINMWGNCYEDDTQLPFESNYPHIIGKFWFEPDFIKTDEVIEKSYQDFLKLDLICTINNSDNTQSEFPLRENVMLQPSNYEGILAFNVGLGPEDAFLMNTNCSLKLKFSVTYNGNKILEENREIKIYILELEVVTNPSSFNRSVLWSLYENQYKIPDILVSVDDSVFTYIQGNLTLGEREFDYGVEISHTYDDNFTTYQIDSFSELLTIRGLFSITPFKVMGKKLDQNYEFQKGIDWIPNDNPLSLGDYSQVIFIGDHPDNNTIFVVLYEFNFTFTEGYYGYISLNGPSSSGILDTSIKFDFFNNCLNKTKNDSGPLYIRYVESFEAGSDQYQLSYSIRDLQSWENNFIIYNPHDLEPFSVSINNTGYPLLTFEEVQQTNFTVIYGIRAQYDLGYGFQKINGFYSNSIRMIYNNENDTNSIIDEANNTLNTATLNDNALYIDLSRSMSEIILNIERIPLLCDPEIFLNIKLDPIVMERIRKSNDLGVIQIKVQVNLSNGTSFLNSLFEMPLNYTLLEPYLDPQGSYNYNFTSNFQELFELYGMDVVDLWVSFTQINEDGPNLPYLLVQEFKYLYNTHYLFINDHKPRDPYGDLDVHAAIRTDHYYQIFSTPLRDSRYYPQFEDSLYDLAANSEVNIVIIGMENLTLVSTHVSPSTHYVFNYLGFTQNITVKDEYYNMIPNLGLFIDLYNINTPVVQEGFVCLYNGSDFSDDFILEKRHFYIVVYPYRQVPDNFLENFFPIVYNALTIDSRANYRSYFHDHQLSPFEYSLSINEFFNELESFRLSLGDYLEPPDNLAPIQNIEYPNEDQWFGLIAPEFELTLIETNLIKLWYNLNELAINFSCASIGALNQTVWELLDDGRVVIKFFALDDLGIMTFEKIEIYKDTTRPLTSLEFVPYENYNVVNYSTIFRFIAMDNNGSGVNTTFYKINGGDWINYNESFTLEGLPLGDISISFYSIDQVGNAELIQSITVNLKVEEGEDTPSQPTPLIPGYNLLLLLLSFISISAISIIINRKKLTTK